ncbi:MAG: LuxR C-terminal-related transcriptional regulator [Bernardetiaceae bacterium]|nr:LuxR C-terminal-related transcriptional regulator [Bernardetiaceae bacterium]
METLKNDQCPRTFSQWRDHWQREERLPLSNQPLPAGIFQNNPALELVLCVGHCAVAIADEQAQQYLYVSESVADVLGLSADALRAGGPSRLFERIVPEDQPLVERARGLCYGFLADLKPEERLGSRLALDFHLRKRTDTPARVLQQTTVLTLQDNAHRPPRLTLNIFTDISHWKPNGHLVASVQTGRQQYNCQLPVQSALLPSRLLSRREQEVLRWLAQGARTSQIADKLFISQHTVEWHRKNILKKLGAKSSSEAVQIGLHGGLI